MVSIQKKTCPSCGSPGSSAYCGDCGEQMQERDYSTWQFLKRSFAHLTSLDNKVYRSFKLLLVRPGYLSDVYFEGRRRPYLRPIQLFIIANLVYFLVQPITIFNTFNNTLSSHMHRQIYSKSAGLAERVSAEVVARNIPFAQYEALFNQQSTAYAKSFIFMVVFLFGILLYAFYGRSRKYFVEHLVFSLHLFAFLLLFVFSFFLLVYGFGLQMVYQGFLTDVLAQLPENSVWEGIVHTFNEHITAPILIGYLYFASRRYYGESRLSCFVKSVGLNVLMLFVIYTYRFLLFWITFYSI